MRQLKRMETISLAPVYSYFSETVTGEKNIQSLMSASKIQRFDDNLLNEKVIF